MSQLAAISHIPIWMTILFRLPDTRHVVDGYFIHVGLKYVSEEGRRSLVNVFLF